MVLQSPSKIESMVLKSYLSKDKCQVSSMRIMFRRIELSDEDNLFELEKEVFPSLLTITSDNNLLYFEKDLCRLQLWSMESKRIILECQTTNDVTQVYASSRNRYYLIGYQSGVLEIRNSTNLKVV